MSMPPPSSSGEASRPLETHILIVGTGAVGAFYGSRLHQPERKIFVSFVCRSNYEQVKTQGLKFETHSFGNYNLEPFKVFETVEESAHEGPGHGMRWNYVILCTKLLLGRVDDSQILEPLLRAQETDEEEVIHHENKSKVDCLVLIQNGIGFEDLHRSCYPSLPIISAVTTMNAQQIQPGLIRQNRWTKISLGPYLDFNYSNQARKPIKEKARRDCVDCCKTLVDLLKLGGVSDAEEFGEVELQIIRWHKLAINASMNPSSILSGGLTNSQMVSKPLIRTHLIETMNEILEAGKTIYGITEYPSKLATVDKIIRSTERAGDNVKASMLIDWEHNRPLELEAILGSPLRIASNFKISLARVQSMYAFLVELQSSRMGSPRQSGTIAKM